MTHGILLLVVAALPALHGLLGRESPSAGAGSVLAADSQAATASGSERGFMLKPLPSSGDVKPPDRPKPILYTAKSGDTLALLAVRFGLRLDTLRSSNNITDEAAILKPNQKVWIPPTNGVLVKIAAGDTVASLAQKWHLDAETIIQYNLIRDPDHLQQGDMLMLPDGTGVATPQDSKAELPDSSQAIPFGHSDYNHFPFGQCTYWVASQRDIPWNGNAWEWFGQAQAAGLKTGKTPRVGAIMVTWESRYYGHVALVEQVFPDGSWLISEMNYKGLGVVDRRHIHTGEVPLIGFIY